MKKCLVLFRRNIFFLDFLTHTGYHFVRLKLSSFPFTKYEVIYKYIITIEMKYCNNYYWMNWCDIVVARELKYNYYRLAVQKSPIKNRTWYQNKQNRLINTEREPIFYLPYSWREIQVIFINVAPIRFNFHRFYMIIFNQL